MNSCCAFGFSRSVVSSRRNSLSEMRSLSSASTSAQVSSDIEWSSFIHIHPWRESDGYRCEAPDEFERGYRTLRQLVAPVPWPLREWCRYRRSTASTIPHPV